MIIFIAKEYASLVVVVLLPDLLRISQSVRVGENTLVCIPACCENLKAQPPKLSTRAQPVPP